MAIALPFIAQTCSACTIPYNYSTPCELTEEMGPSYSLPQRDLGVVSRVERPMIMYFQTCRPSRNSSYRRRSQAPIKNRRNKISGIQTRKYHNIIQRGGADCSQRR